jgi:PAS domain S-box-containing protein
VHKLLARQLRAASRKEGGGLDVDALIAILDQTYDEFDRERRLNDRAATLMEDELKAANMQAQREHSAVLAAILDNASDGMIVVRDGGLIETANGAAEKQFAAPSGGLARQWIGKLLGQVAHDIASRESPSERAQEASGTALNGRVFPVEFSVATLDTSSGRRQLWIVRDISERVRTQREIMESRLRFQDFAEASSDCFWEMDESLKKVIVSSSLESDLPAQVASVLTVDAEGNPPDKISEHSWKELRGHLAGRERFWLRLELKNRADSLWLSISGKPVFDLEGHFRGYRGTGRDVTREVIAREAAQIAERRLIEAMDAAPSAVALLDIDLNLVGGNSALKKVVPSNDGLPLNRNFADLFTKALNNGSESQKESPGELLRSLAITGGMREIALGPSWYLIAARGLSDGGMVLTFSDVTALKQRESELAEAKVAAESASRLKSQFLATMSHELRTPLNAILGFSEVIRDSVFGVGEAATAKYTEYAASIHSSGRHLLSLISEILDLSKIEAGSYVLDIARLDLREILEDILRIMKPAADQAGVDLRAGLPDTSVWLAADARALRQIALNLVANAVKFTPKGGRVAVDLMTKGSIAEFTITDTGIGIAKEHMQTVFELFRQVDSSLSRRHEGTGLGLAISKRLVELHGGTIALESELAVGTCVSVRLPCIAGETQGCLSFSDVAA